MIEKDYPSNSRPRREPAPEKREREEVKQVVTGPVTFRKRSLGRKFIEIFVGDGAEKTGVFNYMLEEVMIPMAKDMVTEAVAGGIERAIYPEGGRRSRSRGMGRHVNYNEISRSGSVISRRDDDRRETHRGGPTREFEQVYTNTRAEAFQVLDVMKEILEHYHIVTVAELYGAVGRRSTHIEQDWGWEDLRGADVQYTRSGYLINLPQPEHLG